MMKIRFDRLSELYGRIAETQSLYLPIEKDGHVDFSRWDEEKTVRMDVVNTNRSPKDLFFPQVENMVAFAMEGKNISIIQQERSKEKFVLMGVRACDARAFRVLDQVFLADPVDTFYAARRENGTVVTMACNAPNETCFCKTFGVTPEEPEDCDVVTWRIGDELYWKSVTEKGAALTETVKDLFEEADEAQVELEKKQIEKTMAELPLADLTTEGFTGERMNELFESKDWEGLSEACIACGTCTFNCPTCQCYDIRDYDTGHGVQRYRCWDSCMYSDFTMMAHDTNRATQMQRFRQRFMHKLVYYPMKNGGMYSCVGCGRCVEKCPVHMNIVKVMRALGGKKA